MTIVNCQVNDCRHNRRDDDTCRLDAISIDDGRECLRYVRDMDYLREMWRSK
ncbi:hypothetical protein ES703_51332 [subsurface metagenome]